MKDNLKAQFDRFKEAARELGTNDDPERFKEMVGKVAKAPPTKQGDKPKTPKPGR